jgi:hypothetical protein
VASPRDNGSSVPSVVSGRHRSTFADDRALAKDDVVAKQTTRGDGRVMAPTTPSSPARTSNRPPFERSSRCGSAIQRTLEPAGLPLIPWQSCKGADAGEPRPAGEGSECGAHAGREPTRSNRHLGPLPERSGRLAAESPTASCPEGGVPLQPQRCRHTGRSGGAQGPGCRAAVRAAHCVAWTL